MGKRGAPEPLAPRPTPAAPARREERRPGERAAPERATRDGQEKSPRARGAPRAEGRERRGPPGARGARERGDGAQEDEAQAASADGASDGASDDASDGEDGASKASDSGSASDNASNSDSAVESDKRRRVQSSTVEQGESAGRVELSAIDAKIAALEAALQQGGDDDDEEDDEEEDEHEERAGGSAVGTGVRVRKDGVLQVFANDLQELEPIPALPRHLLPAVGMSSRAGRKAAGARREQEKPNARQEQEEGGGTAGEDDELREGVATRAEPSKPSQPQTRHVCDACNDMVFIGEDAWKKHKRSLLHRQNLVLAAGAAFETAERRSLFCRPCQQTFASAEELMSHRETDEHAAGVHKERKASHCIVCRKQFTSPAQLKEHVGGKAHKEELQRVREHAQYEPGAPAGAGAPGGAVAAPSAHLAHPSAAGAARGRGPHGASWRARAAPPAAPSTDRTK
jgi:hypothetical protein